MNIQPVRFGGAFWALLGICLTPVGSGAALAESASRLSNERIERQTDGFDRTAPLFELGQDFLGTGNIGSGFTLPTGAVWQPQLLLFGTYRTALQTFDDGSHDNDNGNNRVSEWANRLDLFAQLKLSGTERFILGMRPLDDAVSESPRRGKNRFSGYNFEPGNDDGFVNELNPDITTAYFEGDFGEIFPNLDPEESHALDWGFSVGRQPLFKQEGMLVNDIIDAIGIVRNSIYLPGVSNLRVNAIYGWHELHRDDNTQDNTANFFGVFSEFDFDCCTVDVDFAFVGSDDDDSGDGVYAGISSVQRLSHFNTAFRILHSSALDNETDAVSTGTLLFSEVSFTPHGTHNLAYANLFWGIDEFSSAARSPTAGGPLGRTGILFAAIGLGRYGAPLGNRVDNSVGGAVGYQIFLDHTRKQLIFEFGARTGSNNRQGQQSESPSGFAFATRYQQAVGSHVVLSVDGFIGDNSNADTVANGLRGEMLFKF